MACSISTYGCNDEVSTNFWLYTRLQRFWVSSSELMIFLAKGFLAVIFIQLLDLPLEKKKESLFSEITNGRQRKYCAYVEVIVHETTNQTFPMILGFLRFWKSIKSLSIKASRNSAPVIQCSRLNRTIQTAQMSTSVLLMGCPCAEGRGGVLLTDKYSSRCHRAQETKHRTCPVPLHTHKHTHQHKHLLAVLKL